MMKKLLKASVGLLALFILGCSEPERSQVVIYASVDQLFSQPILSRFEKETGIAVKAIYDTEAQKTVGLENRLYAEKERPQADVFWNGEFMRTLRLAEAGILTPYTSPSAKDIPASFQSPENLWAGFGQRVRVFVVNTNLVPPDKMPHKLEDLADPQWRGKTCMAKPYFGTTSTHFTALRTKMGEEQYADLLKKLHANDVALLSGNATVRDTVVRGDCVFGLTDTDDVNVAIAKHEPVKMVFPDADGDGAFAVFHTVALVKNGPNPEAGRRLIDYLLSVAVEQELVSMGAVQYSVRGGANTPRVWTHTEGLLSALEPSAELVRTHLDK